MERLKLNIYVYTCLKLGYLLSGRVNGEEGGGTLPTIQTSLE